MGKFKNDEDLDEFDMRGVTAGGAAKTGSMKVYKRINFHPSRKRAEEKFEEGTRGKAAELRFEQICNEIISQKKLWWLIKCTHATHCEDHKHQTDYKLLSIHPGSYRFYIRIQVKHSQFHLKPLDPSVDLVIVNVNVSYFAVLCRLKEIYANRSHFPQEVVG